VKDRIDRSKLLVSISMGSESESDALGSHESPKEPLGERGEATSCGCGTIDQIVTTQNRVAPECAERRNNVSAPVWTTKTTNIRP
jgi:hypothetical protein